MGYERIIQRLVDIQEKSIIDSNKIHEKGMEINKSLADRTDILTKAIEENNKYLKAIFGALLVMIVLLFAFI